MKKVIVCAFILLSIASNLSYAAGHIKIVGSSTVFPFSAVVAEHFGKRSGHKTPIIESTGTGGGFKMFCSGIGTKYPDINNASRQIKKSEKKRCTAKGITPIEVKIGYDGIVMAQLKSNQTFNLTLKQIFLALAKTVPVKGKLVKNPFIYWQDVDKSLPKRKIKVLGPPPTSGTRDAFVEIAMQGGAEQFAMLQKLKKTNKKKFKNISHTVRTDGAYVEVGENDNLIIQKLKTNPDAVGIFGFGHLEENADVVTGIKIDNIEPTYENIVTKTYPVSRSLFFYIKKEHLKLNPSIASFVKTFTSANMWGEDGYLADKGMIILDESQQNEIIKRLKQNNI